MKDQFGRQIDYLRLSLTERCTLRCAYCRADEGECPKKKELTQPEFLRIVRVMCKLGIRKVRLTGGEPMLRRDLLEIAEGIRQIDDISELTMTTNAQHLPGKAVLLKRAGIDRLNISIDSLQPERYRALTGGGELNKVLTGIDEALAAGLQPLKLNTVILRGTNDDEVDDFIAFTKDRPLEVRFIELMPMGSVDRSAERVTGAELQKSRPELQPLPKRYPGQPSDDFQMPGYAGIVGFINPVSHRFCNDCSRVRVMSDGMLRPCLGDNREIALKPALEQSDDGELERIIRQAIWDKPSNHGFDGAFHPEKNMSRIGG